MRLGKEQAVGYVEDTEDETLPEQVLTVERAESLPLIPAAEPVLPV